MFVLCDLGDEHLEDVATRNIFTSLVIVSNWRNIVYNRIKRNTGAESFTFLLTVLHVPGSSGDRL
jgi:hypothetical protein